MNQSKEVASLTTKRLSPLAKPFTINRSTHQPSSNLSLSSTQEPSLHTLDHCNDDPFSSLLDSFRKSNFGFKGDSAVSMPFDNNRFGHDTVKTTLPVETATQTRENSHFEQHPSLEFQKNGEFDGLNRSNFDIVEDFSLPTYSPNVTRLGYWTRVGNEVSYGKQVVNFHESLFGEGYDVGSSVDDASMLEQGKHGVDGLNPCLTVSDGILKKSSGTIGGKDVLSNCEGTIHAADESSSFPNCKVPPLKLSTTDMSSAKNTPQIQPSKNSGDSDSDEDSPCWKGTMAFCPTPSETSGSVKSDHVEKSTEKHNSLNPLAPHFFPGIGYIKDDFAASNSSVPVATNLLPGEDILMKTFMDESPIELNKRIEFQHSINICGRENSSIMFNDEKCSSVDPVPNSLCMMTQSSSKEGSSMSKGKLATIVDVDDSLNGSKYPRTSGSTSGVFPAKGHSSTTTSTISSSSSSQVDVITDLFKTLEGVLKSPKPDCQMMVSTMRVLSELLVQTCVDRVDSYNEHDHDMFQQIINNLNIFSTKVYGQSLPTLVSTQADSTYCLSSSSELPKGLEVASIVPPELYMMNDYMRKNSVSEVVGQSGQSCFASSSDQCPEKGNEIAQVIRRSVGKSLDFEKQMHPEALLFKNLWLDCEAERCYRRYKTYRCLMEAGMDVNCTNVADLWR